MSRSRRSRIAHSIVVAALAGDAETSLVAELAGALDRLEGGPRDSAAALLRSLTELFDSRR